MLKIVTLFRTLRVVYFSEVSLNRIELSFHICPLANRNFKTLAHGNSLEHTFKRSILVINDARKFFQIQFVRLIVLLAFSKFVKSQFFLCINWFWSRPFRNNGFSTGENFVIVRFDNSSTFDKKYTWNLIESGLLLIY